jgi:hypothetical protein
MTRYGPQWSNLGHLAQACAEDQLRGFRSRLASAIRVGRM